MQVPVVLTNANQSFTDTQKAQGRTNIGAASTSDLSTEVTNRSNADTTLQNNIDNEASARTNADTLLQNQINNKISSVTADGVVVDATTVDNAVTISGHQVTVRNTTNTAAPTFGGTLDLYHLNGNDQYGRITGVEKLTITMPSSTATTSAAGLMSASDKSKLTNVANNLSTETENRTAADTALSDRINTEINNRQSADGALNGSLTMEVNARQSADNTLTAAVAGKQDKLTAGTNITITNNVISASGEQTLASSSSLVNANGWAANSIGYAASTTMFTTPADMAWSTGNGTYNHPTNVSSTSGLFQMYLIYGSDSSVQKYTVINSFKLSRCGFCGLLEGTVVLNPQSASGWYFGTGAGPYTSTGISPKDQSILVVQLASSHGLMTGGGLVLFTGESTVFCNIYNNGTNSVMNFAATTTFGNFTAGTAYEFHIPVSFTTAV